MGAFRELPHFIGESLSNLAIQLKYSDSNILILNGEINELQARFPDVYENILSCRHNRDSRTPLEYAQDLVASWLFEDYLIEKLKDAGLLITHAGADKDREILSHRRVSASSDSSVSYNGKNRLLEIMTDYTGFWNKNGLIHLRDSKYKKLEQSNSLFIGFSTKDSSYVLYDFANKIDADYISYHYPYGGKPAYAVKINKNDLHPFYVESVIADIKKCMQ